MDQFIHAMLNKGVPRYAINLIVMSEEWQNKIKYFNENETSNLSLSYL